MSKNMDLLLHYYIEFRNTDCFGMESALFCGEGRTGRKETSSEPHRTIFDPF